MTHADQVIWDNSAGSIFDQIAKNQASVATITNPISVIRIRDFIGYEVQWLKFDSCASNIDHKHWSFAYCVVRHVDADNTICS